MMAQVSRLAGTICVGRGVWQPLVGRDRGCRLDHCSRGAPEAAIPAGLPHSGRMSPAASPYIPRQCSQSSTSCRRRSEGGDGTQDVLEQAARDHHHHEPPLPPSPSSRSPKKRLQINAQQIIHILLEMTYLRRTFDPSSHRCSSYLPTYPSVDFHRDLTRDFH